MCVTVGNDATAAAGARWWRRAPDPRPGLRAL